MNTRFNYSQAIIPKTMDLSIFVPSLEMGEIDAQLIQDILSESYEKRKYMAQQWSWFVGNGDPILYRKYVIDGQEQTDKINNRINHDFIGRIVNTKTGYLFGTDVTYQLDKDRYTGIGEAVRSVIGNSQYKSDTATLNDWIAAESMRDQQVEIGKYAITCGQSGRLLWHDGSNIVHSYVVKPWECLFITDGEIYDAEYSMRIYEVIEDYVNDIKKMYVEFYTPTERYIFHGYNETNNEVGYTNFTLESQEPHGFSYNPLVGYANNREIQGECEKVLNKILDYDRAVSDLSSEFEQLRLAYMVFQDVGKIDKETLEQMRQTGAIQVNSRGNIGGTNVYFLTKDIQANAINAHLERERDDINADAGTVDFTNPKLYTNLSSVAMKMRTMQLENKSKITESKFRAADRKLWKVLFDFWARTGKAQMDYLAVHETWNRNLPYNKLEEAQVIATLKGNLSDQTVYAQSVFVEDPDREMLNMESEGIDMLGDNDAER